jgi:hypothetical protein
MMGQTITITFGGLFRRIATRYETTDENYLAVVTIAATVRSLK